MPDGGTTMIGKIAKKEMTEMFRDGRFRLASAVVTVLLLASLGAGWKQYSNLKNQHETAQRAERQNWLGQKPKNPHQGAHYGVYAFKPKSQLSMVDTGVDPYVGVAVYLEAHKQNEFKFRPAQDAATSIQRFGELTAAVVLQVLIPLLIVLLTFSTFAGEREQGTLRQVLSLGVERSRLAMGKALGVAGALAAVLIPATLIGVSTLALTSTTGLLSADFSRTLLMIAAYGLYFAVFVGLSLAVSALCSSSRVALVILLSFWIVNGLIATRAFSDLAGFLHPTPSAVDFDVALQRDLADTKELNAKLDEIRTGLFEKYGVNKLDDLPVNFRAISLQEAENHGYTVFEKHFGDVFDRFERQNAVYQWGSAVAPLLAVRSLSMALAGTDFAHHRHFTVAAEDYRRTIIKYMNDDILVHPVKDGEEYIAGSELWQKVPQFQYEAPGAAWALSHYTTSIALLMVWLAGVAAAVVFAARRVHA
jgi:ABC-2 type transport system permease protein